MVFNYVIIEDTLGALKNLQTSLKSYENFKEIGLANNPSQGIAMVQSLRPHLVFLDVELGEANGFDVLREIRLFSTELPFFIMTTDYVKYAKEAVNADALYFLDKPIDPDELELALLKFQKKFAEIQSHLTLKTSEGHFFIQFQDIVYLEADNNACKIIRKNAKNSMFASKTLKEMENTLPPSFIRVHKSFIVNQQYIQMLNTTKKILQLNCNDELIEIPIGTSHLEKLKSLVVI